MNTHKWSPADLTGLGCWLVVHPDHARRRPDGLLEIVPIVGSGTFVCSDPTASVKQEPDGRYLLDLGNGSGSWSIPTGDGDPVRVMHGHLGSHVTDVEVFDRVLTDAEISAFHQRLMQAADTPHIITG